MTDFLPGTYPQPDSDAPKHVRESWKRRVARDYLNPELPTALLKRRYLSNEDELATIAAEFDIPRRQEKTQPRNKRKAAA